MASLVLSGDTSGSITVSAPAVAGSTTQTLVNVTGTLAPIVSGTAQASTSGTSIDFTGIPSWVKRITVMFNGVSSSSTGLMSVALGTSSGIESTGYSGSFLQVHNGITAVPVGVFGTSFQVTPSGASTSAANLWYGQMILSLLGSNSWTMMFTLSPDTTSTTARLSSGAGLKTLSGTLDRLQIAVSAGTFDAGTINIIYE